MADHSLKRRFVFFVFVLVLLTSTAAFAESPSARFESRMVWDNATHRAVLFGGSTPVDSGTKQAYELNDTWEWTGSRWLQRFPLHSPPPRAAMAMVFDSTRNRVVIFGGRQGKLNLNDMWSYDGNDWTQIQPANAPSIRELTSAAYDSARDRIVLFGGTLQTYSGANDKTLTETPIHDTWEFDGTNWRQILPDGPTPLVKKPVLTYDPVRNQTVMIGYDNDNNVATQMFAYDPAAAVWNQLKPALLPPCANEGAMTWQGSNNTILFTGAVCVGSSTTDDTFEWDGTNWTKIALTSSAVRYYGEAITYDPDHQNVVVFGGAPVPGTGAFLTATYTYSGGIWAQQGDVLYPVPRSLFSFVSDPVRNVIYLYGGLNDATSFFDFWTYQNGQFHPTLDGSQPSDCVLPVAAFDTDRQKVVMLCSGGSTWEFDGTAWTEYDTSKKAPPSHEWSSLVYDQTLKKIVFFGGYGASNNSYLDQTWTYDGSVWAQVTKNPPPSRSHTSMWYDPILKKTVIYGGIGRLTSTDRLSRYSDMWSFDGTGWTQIVPTTTPGMRYGALTAVDPKTNHAVIFGGIRVDTDSLNNTIQVYANDMWDWDGTNWTKVNTAAVPPVRENGGLAVDPLRNQLVMFGGYSGFYHSDLWSFVNGNWTQMTEVINRRRAAR
ncbi:MAG TPA: kelch repeat-containing protein [Thermoanaerobaculia bacterium]|nr:kelch repeat-containing protein [Thermoanaerobaculia bacterium]